MSFIPALRFFVVPIGEKGNQDSSRMTFEQGDFSLWQREIERDLNRGEKKRRGVCPS